ncbi:hypothetical protein P691DRAFT_760696 [Macrolepiota fuliginosa MF-IS2]|uniref:Uncharacterized protein n=1 Tax=Macrolepiota fuliginosa MF-IS2 TaxID=1400762 RepID=A0A9P6C0N5_9AGAR|nr:hypothetical protein P691DRAFT_760696 [Macrolepiota fuliginosa MF-IS2]
MPDTVVIIPHPPALKVGGRRRSMSNKPRTPNTGGAQLTEPAASEETASPESPTDGYPRPAPPSEGQAHPHDAHHQYQDEEQARKEKKHTPNDNEKMKEYAHWKVETTRPTRDVQGNVMKTWGASGRIAQPAGKGA